MEQPDRFQKLVAEAKHNIAEISPDSTRTEAARGDAILVDVRD